MKDSQSHPSIGNVWYVTLLVKESGCQTSWRNSIGYRVTLPPLSDLIIRVSGGSDMDLALFQTTVVLPTSTAGKTGRNVWNRSFPLLTMVSITIVHGEDTYKLLDLWVRKNLQVVWFASRRTSQSHGLLPLSLVSISGANKTFGTSFVPERIAHGLETLFVSTTRVLIRSFALRGPGMVRWQRLICRMLAIWFRVMR